jgi:hypothetical protein
MYLIATVLAFIAFTATYAVIARLYNATLRAGRHMLVGLFEHEVQTCSIVGEQFIEAFDSYLFHTSSVYQRLHVVKG